MREGGHCTAFLGGRKGTVLIIDVGGRTDVSFLRKEGGGEGQFSAS